jgi:hypothetical protein
MGMIPDGTAALKIMRCRCALRTARRTPPAFIALQRWMEIEKGVELHFSTMQNMGAEKATIPLHPIDSRAGLGQQQNAGNSGLVPSSHRALSKWNSDAPQKEIFKSNAPSHHPQLPRPLQDNGDAHKDGIELRG